MRPGRGHRIQERVLDHVWSYDSSHEFASSLHDSLTWLAETMRTALNQRGWEGVGPTGRGQQTGLRMSQCELRIPAGLNTKAATSPTWSTAGGVRRRWATRPATEVLSGSPSNQIAMRLKHGFAENHPIASDDYREFRARGQPSGFGFRVTNRMFAARARRLSFRLAERSIVGRTESVDLPVRIALPWVATLDSRVTAVT